MPEGIPDGTPGTPLGMPGAPGTSGADGTAGAPPQAATRMAAESAIKATRVLDMRASEAGSGDARGKVR